MKKTIRILFMVIIMLLLLSNYAYADFGFFSGYTSSDGSSMDIDITLGQSGAESSSVEFTERILGAIQAIGSVLSVVALTIIGFRYMFSSVEEKAQMKGILIYYIIGAVLVFATSNLLSIIYNIFKGLE